MNQTFNVYCDESCHLENDGLYNLTMAHWGQHYNELGKERISCRRLG